MLISHAWLKEFVDFESTPSQLAHTLNMMGIEVESYVDNSAIYRKFVTAVVLAKQKHPNADKLSLCTVFDGITERSVVCGAPNVEAGQKIVFAQPGAIVPNGGFTIEPRKIRGVESNGMICSVTELNLGEDGKGIWVLPEDTVVGIPLPEYLQNTDVIYEISITPNRADALSHIGIARVIAAIEDKQVKKSIPHVTESEREIDLKVTVDNPTLCHRYAARFIRDVTIKESPPWLKKRLESVGIRPRNNVVDITNYVLMECGHPLHAFDADVVENNHVVVRTINAEKPYVTLDGKTRQISNDMLMICDTAKELGIAGVMGGENSSIKDSTTNVLIESAYFKPSSIRKTAKTLGIHSDASYRFERGTDIGNIEFALNRATQMIHDIAGGTVDKGFIDIYPQELEQRQVVVRFQKVRDVLGLEMTDEVIESILTKLDFTLLQTTDSYIKILVPTYRVDISQEIDVIEEVAILYNYDNIPLQTTAHINIAPLQIPERLTSSFRRKQLREVLSAMGLNEVITQNQTDKVKTGFTTDSPVTIANPLGEELSLMRNSLIPSMISTIEFNMRNSVDTLRLFEIGKTFSNSESQHSFVKGITEHEYLCIGFSGNIQHKEWYGKEIQNDFYDMKGFVTSLFNYFKIDVNYELDNKNDGLLHNVLTIKIGDSPVGKIGVLNPKVQAMYNLSLPVFLSELDVEQLYLSIQQHKKFKRFSLYPTMQRDLAFIVDKRMNSKEIERTIQNFGTGLLKQVRVFDVYEGKNIHQDKKSIAYSLTFGSDTATLTDDSIDEIIQTIVKQVSIDNSAQLRTE